MYLVKINTPIKPRVNKPDSYYKPYEEYVKLAKYCIKYYCSKKSATHILRNEDIFANIVYKVMYGDWIYDETRSDLTREQFMEYCAKLAIRMYWSVEYKRSLPKTIPIDYIVDEEKIEDTLKAPDDPIDSAILNEQRERIHTEANRLEEPRKSIIKDLIAGSSLEEVAQHYNVSVKEARGMLKTFSRKYVQKGFNPR